MGMGNYKKSLDPFIIGKNVIVNSNTTVDDR